ncbi:MAG: hypothetical protein HY812_11235 [Planctomycetes bacterium]|nr:hypothetical protein [Planctomycetota bacterium]
MRTLTTVLSAAVLFPLLADAAHACHPERATAPLVRPDTPPDADAKGRVTIRSYKAGEDRFEVRGQHLDTLLPFEAFLEDAVGAGTFTSIGVMAVSLEDPDVVILKFDQKQGPLPLGATEVEELCGRLVQVRSGGQVFLEGLVPEFADKKDCQGGAWDKGKDALALPDPAPDADAKGWVEVRTKAKENRDRLDVKVQHVPADTVTFSIFLDDGLGVMTEVGVMTASLVDPCAARLKIDTKSGAPLPFGAHDVEDLAGRALEVRGNDGFTYLTGVVPDL